jgi:hypothetical protein
MVVNPNFGNYAGAVNFSASGLPQGATATFSPSTIPANGGQQTVTLTIQTAASETSQTAWSSEWKRVPLVFALLLFPVAGARRMRKQGVKLSRLLCLLLVLAGVGVTGIMTGCGSGNGVFVQRPQSYTVTITATSGGVQHSNTITLRIE